MELNPNSHMDLMRLRMLNFYRQRPSSGSLTNIVGMAQVARSGGNG